MPCFVGSLGKQLEDLKQQGRGGDAALSKVATQVEVRVSCRWLPPAPRCCARVHAFNLNCLDSSIPGAAGLPAHQRCAGECAKERGGEAGPRAEAARRAECATPRPFRPPALHCTTGGQLLRWPALTNCDGALTLPNRGRKHLRASARARESCLLGSRRRTARRARSGACS